MSIKYCPCDLQCFIRSEGIGPLANWFWQWCRPLGCPSPLTLSLPQPPSHPHLLLYTLLLSSHISSRPPSPPLSLPPISPIPFLLLLSYHLSSSLPPFFLLSFLSPHLLASSFFFSLSLLHFPFLYPVSYLLFSYVFSSFLLILFSSPFPFFLFSPLPPPVFFSPFPSLYHFSYCPFSCLLFSFPSFLSSLSPLLPIPVIDIRKHE